MLTCTGLGDYFLFAHFPRQERLAECVVDFVRSGVVQILTFEINFGTAQLFGQSFSKVQRGRPSRILTLISVKFLFKRFVFSCSGIGLVQLQKSGHQSFRRIAAAENIKISSFVRH